MTERTGKPVPRDDVALAINSQYGRQQNQLHIHTDCIRPEVRQTLRQHVAEIGDTWMALATPLAGHHYRVRRLDGQDLAATPFMLLAQDDDASVPMGAETLVIVGWQFAPGHPGFILLSDRANLTAGDVASGEELQDHSCTVLN